MKVLIVLLPYLAGCFGGDVASWPTPALQRGLLVLPKSSPVASTSNLEQYKTKSYYNEQQTPEILSPEFADKRGVYFVEVPQERIQALRGYRQPQVFQNFQASAHYKQKESNPVNVRYLPLEDTPAQIQSQYRQELPSEVPVVRYLPLPLSEVYRRTEEAREQQAVVQYSEVQPIRGPVYSYSPQALTRILRHVPLY